MAEIRQAEATGGNWLAGCVVGAILGLAGIGLMVVLRWAAGHLQQ